MYIENNEMVSAFNSSYKHAIDNCCLTATPSLTKGDIEIKFGGKNFEKLLLASGVDKTLIFNLILRKELSRKLNDISNMTSHEDFFFTDEEELGDVYSTLFSMADCNMNMEDGKENKDYFARSLKSCKVTFEETLQILDSFAKCYDYAMAKKKEKESKEKENTWFKKEYIFEDDGIIIDKSLGFKIQGEMYEKLLENTKAYVETHGNYMVDEYLPKLKKKAEMQEALLLHVREKEHRKLKHDSDADIAVLVDITKDFATYYGFNNCW